MVQRPRSDGEIDVCDTGDHGESLMERTEVVGGLRLFYSVDVTPTPANRKPDPDVDAPPGLELFQYI